MSLYRHPEQQEGFDQILTLSIADQPSGGYSKADLENTLNRLQQSPRIPSSAWRPQTGPVRGGNRGRYNMGYFAPRGYARGRGRGMSGPQ